MDQLFVGGSREECFDECTRCTANNVGQLGALPGEAPNVLAESLTRLLVAAPKVLGVARAHIGALEVPHENLHEVSLVVDVAGQEVFQPSSC
jgi:hypothetical protein